MTMFIHRKPYLKRREWLANRTTHGNTEGVRTFVQPDAKMSVLIEVHTADMAS